MTPELIAQERNSLKDWVNKVHGVESDKALTRENFLKESWNAMANLVHWNKQNLLIQASVQQSPDLVAGGFAILTMLYGVYTYEPTKRTILNDFTSFLGKDPIEEELKIMEYAKTTRIGSFFPELSRIMPLIREIYGAPEFNAAALPPTPYQAYALFVLNHGDLLRKKMRAEEIFGHLAVGHSMMTKVDHLTKRSDDDS